MSNISLLLACYGNPCLSSASLRCAPVRFQPSGGRGLKPRASFLYKPGKGLHLAHCLGKGERSCLSAPLPVSDMDQLCKTETLRYAMSF
jgi:hypothetical protein